MSSKHCSTLLMLMMMETSQSKKQRMLSLQSVEVNAHHGRKLKKSLSTSTKMVTWRFMLKKPKDKLKHTVEKTQMRSFAQRVRETGKNWKISLLPWMLIRVEVSQLKKLKHSLKSIVDPSQKKEKDLPKQRPRH